LSWSSEKQLFAIEVGEELLAQSAKHAFDLSPTFRLIGARVNDQCAQRGGDAGQLRRAVHLGVVDIQASGHAPRLHRLAQTIQAGIEPLVGVELGVGNKAAGVVERGV
jgi:hypothetical protein